MSDTTLDHPSLEAQLVDHARRAPRHADLRAAEALVGALAGRAGVLAAARSDGVAVVTLHDAQDRTTWAWRVEPGAYRVGWHGELRCRDARVAWVGGLASPEDVVTCLVEEWRALVGG